jgi:hypothetical protein
VNAERDRPGHVILIRGERWITLAGLAESWDVELAWVEEVYEHGLLGPGRSVEEQLAVPEPMHDRLATIRRLALVHGVNLAGIAIILDLMEPDAP